jgi:sugar phosphate isomerase/epimerase
VAGVGFKAIELIAWNDDFLDNYWTRPKIADMRRELASSAIALSQFVHTPQDLSHPDAGKRKAAVGQWQKAVAVGAELGSPIINMVAAHPFAMRDTVEIPRITTKPLVQKYATRNVPRGVNWMQNFNDYVEALRECAEACGKAGVRMSVEPHPGRYLANHDGALRLIEHVDHPAMGINFDPSHTFPIGDFPNITVYRLGQHIIHLHCSDNDGVTNVHWRPGLGKIDWVAMFQALRDVGYDGVVSIELEDVPGVSRGPNSSAPGVYRNVTATEEFVAETVAGMNYLKGICKDLGIPVD